jgi:NADH-quinone oxidoreductase subunit G
VRVAAQIAQTLASAQRPLLVCGTGCGSEAVIRAVAAISHALSAARDGKVVDAHFVVPECNSLGLALLGGKPLSEAFATVARGEADTLVALENDLYRRAAKPWVDRLLERTRQIIVLDHVLHRTAESAQLVLPAASFAESEGTFVSGEGRAQRYFAVYPPAGDIRASWRWLMDAGRLEWSGMEELTAACARAVPALAKIVEAAPGADARVGGQKIPRQTHRYSGRTALLAHARIHEPKQIEDAESALAYSMEGAQSGRPPALNPYVWAPGWNSNQAVHKFQDEAGGHLRGGDPGARLLEPALRPEPYRPEEFPAAAPPPERGLRVVGLHPIFGAEELSMFAPAVAERAPSPYLALHPEDAAELGLEAGATVEIKLGEEILALPVRLDSGLARGLAGIPLGLPELPWADLENRFAMPSLRTSDSA